MYSGDLADVVFRALEAFEDLPDLMNVGLGHDYTINEYYAIVAQVIGWRGAFVHDLTKPVGMKRKLVSTQRLNAWGWKSKTLLEQGIKQSYDFYLESNR
jgi:GDP-L-fucose synthase